MKLWRRSEQRGLTVVPSASPLYLALSGSTVTPTTALCNPNVWACVRVLSDAAASCPLVVYRRLEDDGRRRVGGRTADLLQRPAEGTTQADLVSTLMLHLTTFGNAYLGKYRDSDGRIEQLLPLNPATVSVERRAGRIRFAVTIDGHESEHGLDDIVHIKALSSDGLTGLSPIRQMRTAIELDDAVRVASSALFKNFATPSGILSATSLTAPQADSLKQQWLDAQAGERGGGVAVMSGDLTWTQLAMPSDDAQFVEQRKLSATEIARAFRIPPWLVAASDDNSMTYSNTESQSLAFVTYSLQPWLTSIEQALTNDRDLFGPSTFCEFLIDGLLRADSRTRSEVYGRALDPTAGWMRRDEVRRAENLEPESPDDLAAVVAGLSATNGAVA